MRRIAASLLPLALFAALPPALAQDRPSPGEAVSRGGYANPTAIIAAEAALSRLAREKGQWAAMLAMSSPDAVMLVPQLTYARKWLKGRAEPATPRQWQPHELWASCDGDLVVSQGAWTEGQRQGNYTSIWKRQGDGTYAWLFTHGDGLAEPLAAPEMLPAHVADCPAPRPERRDDPAQRRKPAREPRQPGADRLPALDPAHHGGRSADGSIAWDVTVDRGGAHNLSITWKKDGKDQQLTIEEVAAPGAR